jgi:hypothetical protein
MSSNAVLRSSSSTCRPPRDSANASAPPATPAPMIATSHADVAMRSLASHVMSQLPFPGPAPPTFRGAGVSRLRCDCMHAVV